MLLCCLHQVWTVPLSSKPLWETLGMRWRVGESHPTAKNLLIFHTRRILLNKFTSSPIINVIPSLSNSNFEGITLRKFHQQLQLFLLYHFFNISLYVRTCQLQHGKGIEWLKFSQAKFPFKWKSSISISNAICRTLFFLILVLIFLLLPFLLQAV